MRLRLLLLATCLIALFTVRPAVSSSTLVGVRWSDLSDLQRLSQAATLRFVAPGVAIASTSSAAVDTEVLFRDVARAGEAYFLSDHLHAAVLPPWITAVYRDPTGWTLWRLPVARLTEALEHEHFLYPLPQRYATPTPAPALRRAAREPSAVVTDLLGQVEAERLRDLVGRLAFVDPAAGAIAGNVRTRYARRPETFESTLLLRDRLAAILGEQNVRLDSFRIAPGDSLMYNVVGELPGTDPAAGTYIVCAHYDAIGTRSRRSDMARIGQDSVRWNWQTHPAPGADDNASGVAVVVESARVLAQAPPSTWSVRFIAWSGEELGLWGSRHYADAARAADERILGVLNFDMVGFNDITDRLELVTNPSSAWIVDHLRGTNERYGIGLQIDVLEDRFAGLSDHAPFWAEGYDAILGIENYLPTDSTSAGFLAGDYRLNSQYHSVVDLPDSINWELVAGVTRLTVAALAQFGAEEGLPNLAVFGGDVRADAEDDLRVQIANLGPADVTGSFDVQLSRCAADSTACEVVATSTWDEPVPSGGVAVLDLPWQRYGDVVFLVEVDPDDRIEEEVEIDDNRAFQGLRLVPSSGLVLFPNPFRPQRDGELRVSGVPTYARLRIYDAAGELVWRGFEEDGAGREIRWTGINAAGFAVASGIYVYDLRTVEGDLLERGKLAVLR